MIISLGYLKTAVENYKENFTTSQTVNAGVSAGFVTLYLILATMFFALELIVVFFAVRRAIQCTKTTQERVVHVVLAITCTFPYMLLSIFFGKCKFDVY